ncbi:MAG: hypothetical protein EHM45_18550 [Desulfobacteraceae bacterium]|nr:MAG: hypothetical protein EHM45_18550 [Desulfobacteraceae bacterium]
MKLRFKILLMGLLSIGNVLAQDELPTIKNPLGSATLPLPELLKLYQATDRAQEKPKKSPPVKASLTSMQLEGRLLEDALDITAHLEVAVLADDEWVTVPLLDIDKTVSISSLPDIENAVIARTPKNISLVTRVQGKYSFSISFIKKAVQMKQGRKAALGLNNPSKADLILRFDDDLFGLLGENLIFKADHVVAYPVDNVLTVHWKQKRKEAHRGNDTAKRPPVESMISKAHVSSVSTLEGKLISRVRYDLQFEGSKPISFQIPASTVLEKAYLNGRAVSVKNEKNRVDLQVFPARPGDLSGTVELVLTRTYGNYHLGGSLSFSLPEVSWPIHEMYLDLHLPEVFLFKRNSGSFEPVEESPETSFAYQVPLPGKCYSFHQYLITSAAPTLTLDYTVDLTKKYFVAESD